MMTGKDKFDLLKKFTSEVEQQGYSVSDVKEISYGIQFRFTAGLKIGIIRIFEGKKGVRFDFSQVRDSELLKILESLVFSNQDKGPKRSGNKIKETSKDLIEFPDEMIGTDESGKGDFFGPLVIAGAFVNKKNAEILREIGVMDSKKLADKQIFELSVKIKQICPVTVVTIGNKKYNELYERIRNLNKLLAWGHARAIENLLEKHDCSFALSDQFGDEALIKKALLDKGKTITLFQRHKAEEVISVAAASIIARAEYVNRLNQLSAKYQLDFPKGASARTIQMAKQFVTKYGKQELENVAKLHFKTMEQL